MKLTILGCGTSSGVPRIGNDWGACDPTEPRNARLRPSILVESATTRILIDTTPDLRAQLLAAKVGSVDAIIWTHDHADHCHGIDDVRQLFHAHGAPVIGYARAATLGALKERFAYVFDGREGYPPVIDAHMLGDTVTIGDIAIRVVDQPHGSISAAGLRFTRNCRSIGYATDFSAMTDDMLRLYQGLDVWVVDALRHRPHPTHPHVDAVLGWIDRLKPHRALFTHMDQSMDYATLCASLPPGVEPAYDGQMVTLA